jgi:hypothetical protein
MKTRLFLLAAALIAASCTTRPMDSYKPVIIPVVNPYIGKLMQHNTELTTVIRIISVDTTYGRFDGVIVQNQNGILCDTVSSYLNDYHECLGCVDGCN